MVSCIMARPAIGRFSSPLTTAKTFGCGASVRFTRFQAADEQQPPEEPRVHIDRASERTVEVLGEPTGVVVIID